MTWNEKRKIIQKEKDSVAEHYRIADELLRAQEIRASIAERELACEMDKRIKLLQEILL